MKKAAKRKQQKKKEAAEQAGDDANFLKVQGNRAFEEKKYDIALDLYTKAIAQDPTAKALFSNRSATYAALKQFQLALQDAEKTIELDPSWARVSGFFHIALHQTQWFSIPAFPLNRRVTSAKHKLWRVSCKQLRLMMRISRA